MTDDNRLTDLVERLRRWNNPDCKDAADAIMELMAALDLFIAYDNTDDEDGAAMMVRYDEAIRAAGAALKETGE